MEKAWAEISFAFSPADTHPKVIDLSFQDLMLKMSKIY
jgi:hypothetical protein